MKTVLVVIGTRPEAIKLAPVVRALRGAGPHLQPVICVTAQHRQMLDQVLTLFEETPDIDLDIMREGQTVTFVTTEILSRIGEFLRRLRPALVVVQGDTTTAMSASLAAFYERIAVGHVEAGLRTADRYSPFPEEINRRLITQLANYHFAATPSAARALLAENVDSSSIYLTGNPVVDAVLWVRDRAKTKVAVVDQSRRLILVTAHRRENFGDPLIRICRAIRGIVESHPDVEVVYPVHPNPNVKDVVQGLLGGVPRVQLVPPVAYDEFISLMSSAYLVLTDSGGIQEEAPVLSKPVLVLRENTERTEALEAGAARLVGTSVERIRDEVERLLSDQHAYSEMARARTLFGDGHAGSRIVAVIEQLLLTRGSGADSARYRPAAIID